jgi:hypothetical protein
MKMPTEGRSVIGGKRRGVQAMRVAQNIDG